MYIIFVAVFTVIFVKGTFQSEEIVKCLKVPDERFQIVCPRGHVIYNPSVLAGISQSGSCRRAPGDCIGQSKDIQNQVNKCHWRNKCEIKLCRKQGVRCQGHLTKASQIDYVIIKRARCIPKEFILDVCANQKSLRKFDFSTGVIRSDRRYPRASVSKKTRNCTVTIPIQESHTLLTMAFQGNQSKMHPDNIKVYRIGRGTSNSTETPLTMSDKVILSGNDTKALKIVATIGRRRQRRKGFIIPFAAYETETLQAFNTLPEDSHDVLRSLDRIFEVKAVIGLCIGNNPGEVTLQCGSDEVIYSTGLSVSGYTRGEPTCMFGNFPCGGLSAEILVQQNACFWKNSCNINWNGDRKIILSTRRSCIGFVASNIGISDYKCVPKNHVYDVCTNVTDTIRSSWGIVRSHPEYPWYFDTEFRDCKRIIKVGKGFSMALIVQDMNLDPDGRDKFSVKHVTRAGREEVMTTKMAKEGAHLTVKGGRLVIRFKPFRASKAGRGFILFFQTDSLQQIRALETIGMVVLAAAVLCYMLKTFCLKQQNMLPTLGAALAIIAGLLVIVGCVIFVTEFKKDYAKDGYTLHAAFYLCLVAAVGACVSGVLTCFNRQQ